jgi:hypothetical protein
MYMPYTEEQLNFIYDRTSGYCHICHKKLAFSNYGKKRARGAWEVEHSKPKVKGGTNRLNNLYAACISCNRDKGTATTRTARSRHGTKRAPLSIEKRNKAKTTNAAAGAVVGGVIGFVFGPLGAVAGAAIGAKLGHKQNPDRIEDDE